MEGDDVVPGLPHGVEVEEEAAVGVVLALENPRTRVVRADQIGADHCRPGQGQENEGHGLEDGAG